MKKGVRKHRGRSELLYYLENPISYIHMFSFCGGEPSLHCFLSSLFYGVAFLCFPEQKKSVTFSLRMNQFTNLTHVVSTVTPHQFRLTERLVLMKILSHSLLYQNLFTDYPQPAMPLFLAESKQNNLAYFLVRVGTGRCV